MLRTMRSVLGSKGCDARSGPERRCRRAPTGCRDVRRASSSPAGNSNSKAARGHWSIRNRIPRRPLGGDLAADCLDESEDHAIRSIDGDLDVEVRSICADFGCPRMVALDRIAGLSPTIPCRRSSSGPSTGRSGNSRPDGRTCRAASRWQWGERAVHQRRAGQVASCLVQSSNAVPDRASGAELVLRGEGSDGRAVGQPELVIAGGPAMRLGRRHASLSRMTEQEVIATTCGPRVVCVIPIRRRRSWILDSASRMNVNSSATVGSPSARPPPRPAPLARPSAGTAAALVPEVVMRSSRRV